MLVVLFFDRFHELHSTSLNSKEKRPVHPSATGGQGNEASSGAR
jgi:hypothetical protein